eukprot:2757882-Amphidinium_carterae.3
MEISRKFEEHQSERLPFISLFELALEKDFFVELVALSQADLFRSPYLALLLLSLTGAYGAETTVNPIRRVVSKSDIQSFHMERLYLCLFVMLPENPAASAPNTPLSAEVTDARPKVQDPNQQTILKVKTPTRRTTSSEPFDGPMTQYQVMDEGSLLMDGLRPLNMSDRSKVSRRGIVCNIEITMLPVMRGSHVADYWKSSERFKRVLDCKSGLPFYRIVPFLVRTYFSPTFK